MILTDPEGDEPLIVSLGHATMNEKEEDLNEIFDKADQKMYKNKKCRSSNNTDGDG